MLWPAPETGAALWRSRLWASDPEVIAIVLATYGLWTTGLLRRTSRRAVIVGSHSIYVHAFRRRFRYGAVFIEPVSRAAMASVEVADGMFPLSVFVRAKFFSSTAFLAPFGSPICRAVRIKRAMPTGPINRH